MGCHLEHFLLIFAMYGQAQRKNREFPLPSRACPNTVISPSSTLPIESLKILNLWDVDVLFNDSSVDVQMEGYVRSIWIFLYKIT